MSAARLTFLKKGNVWAAAARNTSCSRGWLHLLVQSIFAIITVASFILIVMTAIRNPIPSPGLRPTVTPRCQIQGCRVICREAPHYGYPDEYIVNIVSEADAICTTVSLELHNPSFVNNTLPENWLPRMRSNIHSLSIIGGNLMHFPSGAFMSQFTGNVRILVLQNIEIKTWEATSLVGLSSLSTLCIIKSKVDCVQENSLRAVDDTLAALTITESDYWDPVNFTGFRGFEQLTTVDFSHNNFNELINRNSFVGLEVTKILYLNFCKIAAIGAGAFDYLTSIEVLYLNNNRLVSIPSGLFTNIVALENPRPRINLEDNNWHCDCSFDDLRQLVRKDILLVEARCTYPKEMNSITFAQFEYYCNNKSDVNTHTLKITDIADEQKRKPFYTKPVYVNGSYCTKNIANRSFQIISHLYNNVCSSKNYESLNVSALINWRHNYKDDGSKWLRLSYFLKTDEFSVVQIAPIQQKHGYGLLWYQSACPHELFCLDAIPSFLRVYNVDTNIQYTFCPIEVESAVVENEYCLVYDFEAVEKMPSHRDTFSRVIIYLSTVLICLLFGALVVYALIRQKPTLLKGSKRILFVKHKNVDILVLPPKLPLRNDLKPDFVDSKDKEIFTLSTVHELMPPNLKRMKSVMSDKSGSPSYISAMQPTEDQLAEWRIKHHFNNDLTISSTKSELSTLSWICGESYYSLDGSDRTYESLK